MTTAEQQAARRAEIAEKAPLAMRFLEWPSAPAARNKPVYDCALSVVCEYLSGKPLPATPTEPEPAPVKPKPTK